MKSYTLIRNETMHSTVVSLNANNLIKGQIPVTESDPTTFIQTVQTGKKTEEVIEELCILIISNNEFF